MKFIRFFCSLLVIYACSVLASYATMDGNYSAWYHGLKKPLLMPENYVFSLAWGIIYTLMVFSLWLLWEKAMKGRVPLGIFGFFFLQLVMTVLWPYLFFGLRLLWPSLIFIFFLWVVVILTMLYSGKYSIVAGILFVPYFLWLSFAIYLNAMICVLNG